MSGNIAPTCSPVLTSTSASSARPSKMRVGWGVTSRCNMHCSFCYSRGCRHEDSDLALSDWTRFVRENHDLIDSINYGTGENALSPAWFDLISEVRDYDSAIGQAVTTNGYLSEAMRGSDVLRDVVVRSIDEIDVSLDLGTRVEFCSFRGHSRAYDWVIETLEFCAEAGKRATIVVMGVQATLDSANLSRIFNIARAHSAGVRINLYRPVNRAVPLTPPSLPEVLAALDWIHENHHICSISDPLLNAVLTGSGTVKDPSGVSSVRILPSGHVCPSTYLISCDYHIGSIRDSRVLERVTETRMLQAIRGAGLPLECRECELRVRCNGGAIDRRFLWYGTLAERDPYCPLREPGSVDARLRSYCVSGEDLSSIHDGYLPTMFFSPR